jgi:hypothetical protein
LSRNVGGGEAVKVRAEIISSKRLPLMISLKRCGAPSHFEIGFDENQSDRLYPAVLDMYNHMPMNCRNSPNVTAFPFIFLFVSTRMTFSKKDFGMNMRNIVKIASPFSTMSHDTILSIALS